MTPKDRDERASTRLKAVLTRLGFGSVTVWVSGKAARGYGRDKVNGRWWPAGRFLGGEQFAIEDEG